MRQIHRTKKGNKSETQAYQYMSVSVSDENR